ncbi:hypothetical protein glysoja_014438 [Glycine soja]|nr:hypothetical protein glysoja_014438 [Glycine soja]
MWQNQPNNSSYSDSVKALEDDMQHANTLEMNFSHKPWPEMPILII